jgi:hypothetical protein
MQIISTDGHIVQVNFGVTLEVVANHQVLEETPFWSLEESHEFI